MLVPVRLRPLIETVVFSTASRYPGFMFFGKQREAKQQEPEVKETDPEPFVPPVQTPGQSDDAYRLGLIDLIAEIDKTKREIKGQIHSRNIAARQSRTGVDQVWLRRAKDKIDHLTREREEIRKALHTVNERIKAGRRAKNQPKPKAGMTIDAAFRQVAKERLPLDLYDGLMDEAAERMDGGTDLSSCGPRVL